MIVSPYAIASAAALLSQGACGNTFTQLARALNLPNNKFAIANLFHELSADFERNDDDVALNVENRIFVQQGFPISREFIKVAAADFHAGVEAINFAEAAEPTYKINRWAANKTNAKIKDLIKSNTLTKEPQIILVSVIYFRAFWDQSFDITQTAIGKFYINDNYTVNVPYMHMYTGLGYAILNELDATAVKFLYHNSDVGFIVILPNNRNGLSALESKMKDYDMNKIRFNGALVDVTLPKFKIKSKINLKNILKKVLSYDMKCVSSKQTKKSFLFRLKFRWKCL